MSAITDSFLRPVIRYKGMRPYIDLRGMIKSEKPDPPPARHVLLTHTAGQNDVRVTFPDGQTRMHFTGPDIVRELATYGVPKDKIERALDYLWNFYEVYVDCGDINPKVPPLPQ